MRLKPTRWRWLSQIIFFSLFLFLLLRTEFRGSLHAGGNAIRLPYPVQLFFQFDPLVMLSNALSSRALYRGLLWSLAVLLPTMLLGRFFCGWICPLGSIHHFFSSLKSERKRGKQLIESNRYKRWQTTKYYLLVAALIAAVLGTGVVGWLDPFSLLVRSLGLSILPGVNYAVGAGLRMLEHSRWGNGLEGNVLNFLLGGWLLNFKQPYFRQGYLARHHLHLSSGVEFSRDPFLVPGTLPTGRAARHRFALVDSGTGQEPRALRGLQSLPVALSGRR